MTTGWHLALVMSRFAFLMFPASLKRLPVCCVGGWGTHISRSTGEDVPERMSDKLSGQMQRMPGRMSEDVPKRLSERRPENVPERLPERMSDRTSEEMPERMSEEMPERMSDRISGDARKHVRKNARRYARKNVRPSVRYARKHVRPNVRKYVTKVRQKECQKMSDLMFHIWSPCTSSPFTINHIDTSVLRPERFLRTECVFKD